MATAKDGKPVLIVATDGGLHYIGNLITFFDADGVLVRVNEPHSKPWPIDEQSLLELRSSVDKNTLAFEQRAKKELAPMLVEVGRADVLLEGRREFVRNRETNLADASADAMLMFARNSQPDVALAMRNGGGIRQSIHPGPIRLIDVKTALRFDSPVVVVELTHAQLKQTFEASLRGAGTSRGHFPQVSEGVVLEYAVEPPEQKQKVVDGKTVGIECDGARVRGLKVNGTAIVVDGKTPTPDAKIKIATIDYLAKGGDGWFPGQKLDVKPVDGGSEQSAFMALVKSERWKNGTPWVDPHVDDAATRIKLVAAPDVPSSTPGVCK
jgi:5'-nucleotidase / UDP-sugar diphosphatase